MNKRIAIDFTWYFDKAVHAGPKARKDVTSTLLNMGYHAITLYYPHNSMALLTRYAKIKLFVKLYFKELVFSKEIIFQYPSILPIWFLSFLKYQGKKISLIIHDLDRLRQGHLNISRQEKRILQSVNNLIVHTPAMAEYLKSQGIKTSMKSLMLFDYYAEKSHVHRINDFRSLVYCGNLEKSSFLQTLNNLNDWLIPIYLYGIGSLERYANHNLIYKGIFEADYPDNIEGGWGLVWDGHDIDSCESSAIGRYMSYNSSHKISLYFVTGKPILIWTGCALSKWVIEHGLGIAIDSISQIPKILKDMKSEEYEKYVSNVMVIRQRLLSGSFLADALKNIVKN